MPPLRARNSRIPVRANEITGRNTRSSSSSERKSPTEAQISSSDVELRENDREIEESSYEIVISTPPRYSVVRDEMSPSPILNNRHKLLRATRINYPLNSTLIEDNENSSSSEESSSGFNSAIIQSSSSSSQNSSSNNSRTTTSSNSSSSVDNSENSSSSNKRARRVSLPIGRTSAKKTLSKEVKKTPYQRKKEMLKQEKALVFPKVVFKRLIKELMNEFYESEEHSSDRKKRIQNMRLSAEGLEALQEASEAFLSKMFSAAFVLAKHRKRESKHEVTLSPYDLLTAVQLERLLSLSI